MRSRPEVKKAGECFPTPNTESADEEQEDSTEEEEEEEEEEENASQLNQKRVGKTDWCLCGNCTAMNTQKESTCCQEEPAIQALIPDQCSCIIQWDRVTNDILNKERADWAYKITNFKQKKKPKQAAYMRGIRRAAYRSFTTWVYGYLGTGNRKVIPSCIVTAIRAAFPDPKGKYVGFLTAGDFSAEDMIFY
ncbi:P2X purinoceptor 7-like [Xenopus laevis]|uniref:P2X purinoceptor 7-like n=1 Tax=Xenopus laevis TaxID=8355 RepID=A0A8J1KUW9_XENLA|nr:P2X purinoceptor 7-like [Xenopus laevis]